MTIARFPLRYDVVESVTDPKNVDHHFTAISRITTLLYAVPIVSFVPDDETTVDEMVDQLYQLDSYKHLPNFWPLLMRRLVTQLVSTTVWSSSSSATAAVDQNRVTKAVCQRLRSYVCEYLSTTLTSCHEGAAIAAADIELLYTFLMLPITLQLEPVSKHLRFESDANIN